MIRKEIIDLFRVPPGKKIRLKDYDPGWAWTKEARRPERGRIGTFNRSYYEEVLVVRVHPEWLDKQKLPPGKRGMPFWRDRYRDINKWVTRTVVADVITTTIQSLDLKYPELNDDQLQALEEARKQLENE
jgi:hypothetical protein